MTHSGRFWVKKSKRAAHDGPPRAALLCRQSILKKESISLEDQEQRNRAYAEDEGYEVVDVRHSPGVRGWKEDREDHNHFRTLAAQNAIDVVISYDVARTARTMRLMEEFAHDLESVGVRLEFSSQPFANTPMGRQMVTMMAEMETSARSVKLADTWDTLRRRGQWHGKAPYGYARRDRTIVPDEREADTARSIFGRALDGVGTIRLRDELIAAGTPTRLGGTWSETLLSRMLRNPVYAGGMTIDGEIHWPEGQGVAGLGHQDIASHSGRFLGLAEGKTELPANPTVAQWWEPLIERAAWERLQAILPTHAVTRSKPVSSWCEGLVEHACGERMYLIATAPARGGLLPVYRCKDRHHHPPCTLMHREASARNLETAARLAVVRAFATPVDLDALLAERRAQQKTSGTLARRTDLHRRRERLLDQRDRVGFAYTTGRRNRAWFEAQDDAITAELAKLADAEARLPGAVDEDALRALAAAVVSIGETVAEMPGDELALALRTTGGVLVVGEGGVRLRFAPATAAVVAEVEPVKIPRARTR